MSKLFLTSSGISSNLQNIFISLLPDKPEKLRVAFITTAAQILNSQEKKYVNKEKRYLSEINLQIEEIDLKKYSSEEIKMKLRNFDILYFVGGNTYYLLYWIKQLKLESFIKKNLERGMIYVGSSAGSIVAGPDISLAGWKANQKEDGIVLKDLKGLCLVNFTISPHFINNPERINLIQKQTKDFFHPVICLPDKTAIIVNDNYCHIVLNEKKHTSLHYFDRK